MNITYLLLGSNQHNPAGQLAKAAAHIERSIGHIKRMSAVYRTAAWGNTSQPDFLNQVLIVETALAPDVLMHTILTIEAQMGRVRTEKNAPRIIDIDILFYNKEIITTHELVVPHPEIQNRNFVLIPLHELSPNLKHPVLHKTIHQLLRISPDSLTVHKI